MKKDVIKKTIFVVDDDPGILEVMSIILTDKGHHVVSISSGEELFKQLKKHTPDLLFLDIWISGSDGREITQNLRAREETKDIPIVIISALNETAQIAAEVGANGFLEKPFEIDTLLSVVEKYSR